MINVMKNALGLYSRLERKTFDGIREISDEEFNELLRVNKREAVCNRKWVRQRAWFSDFILEF
ncbi:hypothetical protein JCM16418A_19520 [Paenibacillus pini]|uniref:Uncharacterized protein n=1 Tax=Paenibacillus pini JCM 16418 TaxID=1236976 RepID=W7YRU1_9BACL|nr:hypothetical protein JCM16418_1380 [Paenibacillus pini JCM 16418]